ncbi:unnamed protein product, partial [Ectocarpus fasciculatus]
RRTARGNKKKELHRTPSCSRRRITHLTLTSPPNCRATMFGITAVGSICLSLVVVLLSMPSQPAKPIPSRQPAKRRERWWWPEKKKKKPRKTKKKKKAPAAQNNLWQRPQLEPLWKRLLPLAVSGALLHGLYGLFSCFVVQWPHHARVLLSLLCYVGGVALVEAAENATQRVGGVHPAVAHFRANASTYMASFVIIVVMQGAWSETRDCLSSLAMLALGFLVHHVAPRLGGRQPEGGQSSRPVHGSGGGHSRPFLKRLWKTAKKWIPTAVGFALSIAAALVSGGGVLLGLQIAGAVWTAFQEMRLAIREGRPNMQKAPSSTQDSSLQVVVTWITSGPTRRVWSPVLLPTLVLLVTYRTICSWPEECTDWLVLLLKASATAVCTTHLMQQTVREAVAPGQDNGNGGSTTWASKGSEGLRCVCCVAAWTLLLLCSFTVFDRQESLAGILTVVLVVTIVAFRTRCGERTWCGLMLVFSLTLLAILVRVAYLELIHIFEVFNRVKSKDVVVRPWWSRFFHRFDQDFLDFLELCEQERAASWSVCH